MTAARGRRKATHKIAPERIKAIKTAIRLTNGRVTDAAVSLQMPLATLSRLLNHHALQNWWNAFKRERYLARRRKYAKKQYASAKQQLAATKKQLAALRDDFGIDVDDLVGHIK